MAEKYSFLVAGEKNLNRKASPLVVGPLVVGAVVVGKIVVDPP